MTCTLTDYKRIIIGNLSGRPTQHYPWQTLSNEARLLESMLKMNDDQSSAAANKGTSVLLIGPAGPLQDTLLQRCIYQNADERGCCLVLTLHGMVHNDANSILRFFDPSGGMKTFEEIGESLLEKKNPKTVIILRHFEGFAQSNQHFLYTLFELINSAPIYVVGVTARCDAVDLLEKRVKSRFSQNVIYTPLPGSLDAFSEMIRQALLPEGIAESTPKTPSGKYALTMKRLLETDEMKRFMEAAFQISHDPAVSMFPFMLECLMTLNGDTGAIDLTTLPLIKTQSDAFPAGLSLSELCVLVAMRRTAMKNPGDTITIDIIFDEYSVGFATSGISGDASNLHTRFTKTIIKAAVETLLTKGILTSTSSDFRMMPDETVTNRESLSCRMPLSQLPEWLKTQVKRGLYPSILEKLSCENL